MQRKSMKKLPAIFAIFFSLLIIKVLSAKSISNTKKLSGDWNTVEYHLKDDNSNWLSVTGHYEKETSFHFWLSQKYAYTVSNYQMLISISAQFVIPTSINVILGIVLGNVFNAKEPLAKVSLLDKQNCLYFVQISGKNNSATFMSSNCYSSLPPFTHVTTDFNDETDNVTVQIIFLFVFLKPFIFLDSYLCFFKLLDCCVSWTNKTIYLF